MCEVAWPTRDYCALVLHLNPVPASRPRVTRWGTYYAKTYKAWMHAADKAIPQADHKITGHVRVHLRFHIDKPRTTKLSRPRGDLDNYTKAILDAITKKGYWQDDDEIVFLYAQKAFTQHGGRVEVEIYKA